MTTMAPRERKLPGTPIPRRRRRARYVIDREQRTQGGTVSLQRTDHRRHDARASVTGGAAAFYCFFSFLVATR